MISKYLQLMLYVKLRLLTNGNFKKEHKNIVNKWNIQFLAFLLHSGR